jgi:predicted Zn-dependent protease
MNRLETQLRYPIVLLSIALLATGCARNPATGGLELMLVSEAQEIEMGRQADPAIVAQFGLLDDQGLQDYVADLGAQLAARSERPQLPWTFRVVDDPIVNAFALPGGYIYMSRGILAHFNSESQLVSVLGHEIGHVTARHSAAQMSQAQLAQLGLGVGVVLLPDLADFAGLAQTGLGLLFLKFGRDDERQADALGFRYLTRIGYNPRDMPEVFAMLGRVSGASGGPGIPVWLSTHPDPGDRQQRVEAMIAQSGQDFSNATVNAREYLRRLDGLVYGENPREGYFREQLFLHPDMRFQIEFPAGWATANTKQAVMAQSPNEDAIMRLSLADGTSAVGAAQDFVSQEGVEGGRIQTTTVNGYPAAAAEFSAQSDQTALRGAVTFVEYGGAVFGLLGYSTSQGWAGYSQVVRQSMQSFNQLTDRTALTAQPMRMRIVTLDRAMTLGQFNQRYPSSIPLETLAILNQVEVGTTLPTGQLVKRVVGEPAR